MDFGQIFNLTLGEAIGVFTAAYALCALGLAMHFGYTGLLNFGQAAFAALGAYGYAYASLNLHWGVLGSLALGIGASALFALILGIPTLRLRADYLAIVTIAAAQALYYAFGTQEFAPLTGGSNGLSEFGGDFYALNPIPVGRYNLGIITLSQDEIWIRIVAWGLVAIVSVLLLVLTRSPWGRVLKGIREDEDAVRSLGKNVFVYKMQSLVLGGIIGSLGGIVFVLASQTNQASTWVSNFTFMTWTVLLLGGAATILGPIVGSAVFFMFLMLTQTVFEGLVNIGALPFLSIAQVGQIRYLLVGLFLMLLVIFRPQGFFGNKKEMQFNG
jgi:branched-chain amino acid transport system permease protein